MSITFYREPRKRMRLDGFDYSKAGAYFVTICTHNREELLTFGPAQIMLDEFWSKIPEKNDGTALDEFVIMPNHIHGIVFKVGAVPSEARVGPCSKTQALPKIMQWYKTITTNAYLAGIKKSNWPPFSGKLWQRGYFEKVIRSEDELVGYRKYIRENPANWDADLDNPINIISSRSEVKP